MTEEIIVWLRGMDWQTVLVTSHIAGMVLVICAAVAGYAMGVRILFLRGSRPSRAFVGLFHNGVVLGLLLVWCSGGGLLLLDDALLDTQAVWPAALTFKLSTVALLSFSVWLARVFVLPLAQARWRPLAASLGWHQLFGVSLVAAISMSCLVMLIATAFSAEMRALPIERLVGFLGALVALFVVACLVLSGCIRFLTPQRRPDASTRPAGRRHQQRSVRGERRPKLRSTPPGTAQGSASGTLNQEPALVGLTAHAINAMQARQLPQRTMVPQTRPVPQRPIAQPADTSRQPLPSLANRLRPSQHYDPAGQLRDKVAQEWARNARPPAPRPRWTPAAAAAATAAAAAAAQEAEADDWLLHKWLRRPR